MFKKLIIYLAVVIAAYSSIVAQSAYTPEKGSTERTAILNALRIPVERDLKQKIVFAADHFKVQGNWAYLSGAPQTSSGGRPNYRNTKYRDAVDSEAFDHNFFALLKKTGGKWKVTVYAIGCTDVCFADWPSEFKAPKAIFPYMGE